MRNLKEQLSATVQEVLDDNFDSAEVFEQMKSLKTYLDKCIKEIETKVFNDYQENNEHNKYEIIFKNGGWKYDFSNIKEVVFAENELKLLKEKYKNRFLNTDGFSKDTGEVFEDMPNRKPIKSSVTIKIK